MTTSTNPWTPPGETDDAVLERMEAMIAPTFGDEVLPVPARDDAELPWTSGGAAVGIEPDFDVAGLPTLASSDAQLAWTARTGPLTGPGAAPAPPAVPGSPLAPPAVPSGTPLPPPVAAGAVAPAAPSAPAASGPSSLPPPVATAAAPDRAVDPEDRAADPAPRGGSTSWDAPDATLLSPVQLPPPVVLADLDERPWNARPRRGLLVALALSLVAALVAVVLIGTRDPQASPPPIVVPSDPTLADVPGAPEADLPLVLPSSSGVPVDFRSSEVTIVTSWAEGEVSTVISGMRSPEAVSTTVEGSAVGSAGRATVSRRAVVTPRWRFVREQQRWVRSALPAGVFATYEEMLGVRAVDDVVPVEVRPLIDVTQATPVDETTTRYLFEFRTGAFRDQYPELFARWSAIHTNGEVVASGRPWSWTSTIVGSCRGCRSRPPMRR